MELYVHIPFCLRKCAYCDFASFANRESDMAAYVSSVLTEAERKTEKLENRKITTVFIGGGTPSVLPPLLWEKLLRGLREIFLIQEDAEFTSEANPGTLTRPWLEVAKAFGVNRLSLGAQAAQSGLLKTLGRIHTWQEVEASVDLVRSCGFSNLSLDLMFGLPGQTLRDWEETLTRALALDPEHLSCYGLIPEEGTPLVRKLNAGELSLPDEELERDMYDKALLRLAEKGFEQYEISNFARHGRACQHNIGYWRQVPYLGLGVAASSMVFQGTPAYDRLTNTADLSDYLKRIRDGQETAADRQHVSPEEAMFETLMLGLRMTEGVSEQAFEAMHGSSLTAYRGPELERQASLGHLKHENGFWRLTRRGMDIQNSILVDLM